MKLSTAQIGKAGELLVQQKLLLNGIESAPLTTDSGIDLVAFSRKQSDAVTIQVKTNLGPKPGGGKGKPALDWWVPDDSPADLLAFVDLGSSRIWLIKKGELADLAQQHPEGRCHLVMATDPTAAKRKDGKALHDYEFQGHLLENVVHKLI